MKQRNENTPQRSKEKFLIFGSPDFGQEEIDEVVSSIKSGWIGTGPKVQRFEEEFKNYRKAPYAVAVNSCTAALHLSMLAADVGPGDEVITTAMTFCATVNAIIHSGATPVLADCEPDTFCINPEAVKEKITKRTKAIVPVHFAGTSCNMDALMETAKKHNLKVIEDCAHAVETTYRGIPVGTFGDFGCFSFYVTKNVATAEGGMILTKRKEDADRVKVLALHGMSQDAWSRFSDEGYKHYEVIQAGFKYNMTDIQAGIAIQQLKKVELNWLKREKIWRRYKEAFEDLPIALPMDTPREIRHGYHLFTILIDPNKAKLSRDQFLTAMNNENIGTGVHYQSIPFHRYYQERYYWKPSQYPVSERIGNQTVSLPLSPKLTEEDVEDVITAVRKLIK